MTELSAEPIYDLDTCDKILESLEATTSMEEQSALIDRLVAAHQTVNMKMLRGSIYWRARRCGPGGFNNKSEVSYPPPHLADAQRLNDKGQPVLYLSPGRETALTEIGATAGETIHLAGFRVRPNEGLRVASIGEWHHVHKLGTMRFGPREAANQFTRILNTGEYNMSRLMIYIDAVLGDLLARPDAHTIDYLTTRLLVKALYRKHPTIDGIIYPSVKDLGLNLAVRSHAADRAIEGCASLVIEVQRRRRFGVYDYRTIRAARGVKPDGSFVWAPSCQTNEMIIYGIGQDEDEAGVVPYGQVLFRGSLRDSTPE